MEDKQIIFKLQELKQIKPREEWAVLVKSQILGNNKVANKQTYKNLFSNVFNLAFQRKFSYAYSLTVFLFVIVGVFGFLMYNVSNNQSNKNSSWQLSSNAVATKSSIEEFKIKSQNLINVTKNKPQDFALAIKEIKTAANNLTEAVKNDPQLAGEVAMDVKNSGTLLSIISETELEQASDALYKAIDEQMIKDLEKTTLTEDQKISLDEIKNLYNEGKYSEVLEKILLIK